MINKSRRFLVYLLAFIILTGVSYTPAQAVTSTQISPLSNISSTQLASLWNQLKQIQSLLSSFISSQSQLAQVAPTSGLVGYWSFDEGSGTIANDTSGNNNNGTLTNGPTWTTGKVGNGALSFDGADDKVSAGTSFNVSFPFTISAWINPSAVSRNDYRAIFSKRDTPNGADMRFDLGLNITSGNVYIYTGNQTISAYTPPLSTWTLLSMVITSSSANLYVNGVFNQNLGAITLGTDATAKVTIGNTGDDDDPFAGIIDDVRIYNRALSAQEVLDIYNSASGVVPTPTPIPTPTPTPTPTLTPTPTPTPTQTGGIPATLGWYQIPNTQLSSVCAGTHGFPSVLGATGCSAITEAWSSAVLDSTRNRLIIWGGGHNDYYGNEVYALDLNDLIMRRLNDPTLPIASSCVESLAGGTRPNSRHTNDGIAYMSHVDRMFVFGGVPACPGGGFIRGTWTLNLSTLQWQNMNPTGVLPRAEGITTAYDPNTGKVFVHDSVNLYAYTYETNTFQQLSGGTLRVSYSAKGVVDPVRKKLVFIGSGDVLMYDIAPGSNYTPQPLTTTGATSIVSAGAPGLAYDPITDRIVAWDGGNTIYSLNLDTRAWSSVTYSGGPAAISQGTYGRFAYVPTQNLFVTCNSVDSNCSTLRLNSGGGTTPPPPSFDFALSNGGSKFVTQGQSASNVITATLVSGTPQTASFSVSGLPSGTTASVLPASCAPSCTSTLTLSTLSSTPPGSYSVTITGTSGSLFRTTAFTLTVNAVATPPPPTPTGTLQVGPGKPFATVAAAVTAAQSGNVIEIDAGIYSETMTISKSNLTLRGVGGYAHFRWGTGNYVTNTATISNGKGIFVISGSNITLENLEFSGAKVVNENGAGIRYEGGDLTIRNSYFHGNENGILGEGGLTNTLLIEHSIFERNGYCPTLCGHNVYIGQMGTLIFRHNKSVDSIEAHTLKSRARVNQIISNYFSTKNSDGSYEAEFPNGGIVYFIGNIVEQGVNTGNPILLGYGFEGVTNPNPALYAINNTFYNLLGSGTFLGVSGAPTLMVKNNIFAGGGSIGVTADASNKTLTASSFVGLSSSDFHLVSGSPAIDAGVNPGTAGTFDLTPLWEYVEPAGKQARVVAGAALDVGAYEFGAGTPPPPPVDTTAPTVSISAPTSGLTVSGTVTVSANASDNVGVVGVQFKLDGVNLGAEDTTGPYSVSWNTTGTANGSHTLTAVARDAANNSTTSVPVTVTVANTPGTLPVGALVHDGPATPEQLSLFLPVTGSLPQTAVATVRYKPSNSSTWITGHPLYRIRPTFSASPAVGSVPDAFAWPIIDLSPGTSYDVEVTVSSGTTTDVRTASFATRALPPPAGTSNKTITAGSSVSTIQTALNNLNPGDVIEFKNGTYNIGNLQLTRSGTLNNPIYIRGESRAGVVLSDSGRIIQIQSSANVIFENMTLRGSGTDSGTNSSSVALEFGGSSTLTNITFRNLNITGVDRAIGPAVTGQFTASGILVYDNAITGNNVWTSAFLSDNRTWNDDGINLAGRGNVAFNNTITGFGDTFAYASHSGDTGLTEAVGVHYYRNDIRNSLDDLVEVDYGHRNITFYDNRAHNVSTCSSLDPLYGGPWLYARNICINPARVNLHKWNTSGSGQLLYNNTFIITVTAVGYDPDVSAWYQPQSGGAQQSYGYRNNVLVYRGNGNTLWLESTDHDPIDWTHNSWFPNRQIQWGSSFTNLAAAQSGLANTSPIFSGTNRRMENDNITVTNPWTTTVTLGANSITEVTATYTPVLSGGTAPKNSGVVIPNITDGFTGAAPDRGAIIDGRTIPLYGDQSGAIPPTPTPTPTPTPSPTPIPSTKFSLNDRVQVSSGPLNVRSTANGTSLGTQATGVLGTVTGGPTNAGGFNWWNINYDTGVDGWSAEDFLIKYVAPTPTPIIGDFNGDGLVNSIDLSLMTSAWNQNNATYDLNKDGLVNSLDYAIMVQNWSG